MLASPCGASLLNVAWAAAARAKDTDFKLVTHPCGKSELTNVILASGEGMWLPESCEGRAELP